MTLKPLTKTERGGPRCRKSIRAPPPHAAARPQCLCKQRVLHTHAQRACAVGVCLCVSFIRRRAAAIFLAAHVCLPKQKRAAGRPARWYLPQTASGRPGAVAWLARVRTLPPQRTGWSSPAHAASPCPSWFRLSSRWCNVVGTGVCCWCRRCVVAAMCYLFGGRPFKTKHTRDGIRVVRCAHTFRSSAGLRPPSAARRAGRIVLKSHAPCTPRAPLWRQRLRP